MTVDKDRLEGSVEQGKGKAKETAGKVTGDEKLKAEGKSDTAKGKTQNALGSIKDTVKVK